MSAYPSKYDPTGILGLVDANGCVEASKYIPKVYRSFMRQMGMKDVYVVPIRKNGMTGSGIKHECHMNVLKLQLTYGGKVVLGFLVGKTKNELHLLHHSSWMTPEGKLVDVTLNNRKERDFIMFAPIKKYDATKQDWILACSFVVPRKYKKRGLILKDWGSEELNELADQPIRFSPKINMKRLVKEQRPWNLDELGTLKGGFTRPSSATGESWEEIWSNTCSTF